MLQGQNCCLVVHAGSKSEWWALPATTAHCSYNPDYRYTWLHVTCNIFGKLKKQKQVSLRKTNLSQKKWEKTKTMQNIIFPLLEQKPCKMQQPPFYIHLRHSLSSKTNFFSLFGLTCLHSCFVIYFYIL